MTTDPDCYIEVKSVTLLDEQEQPGMGYFPDAVTTRGAKHLRELMAMKAAGHRAVLLFMVLHSGIARMRPAAHIDPHYSQLVEQAMAAGLKFLCYRPHVGVQGMVAQDFIPPSDHMLPGQRINAEVGNITIKACLPPLTLCYRCRPQFMDGTGSVLN